MFSTPLPYEPPEWRVKGDDFPIVGRRFTVDTFRRYLQWVKANEKFLWTPTGITIHHTAAPNLAQRPNGFSEQHMLNLRSYYKDERGWKSGPHIFTDDNGIWVFTPLSRKGVHATSFNATRFGIEMLGDFDGKDFDDPRGKASIENGQWAAAVLIKELEISKARINFHRHDPKTDKTCPGKRIDFTDFEKAVHSKL